jgi:hypothetical protein
MKLEELHFSSTLTPQYTVRPTGTPKVFKNNALPQIITPMAIHNFKIPAYRYPDSLLVILYRQIVEKTNVFLPKQAYFHQ